MEQAAVEGSAGLRYGLKTGGDGSLTSLNSSLEANASPPLLEAIRREVEAAEERLCARVLRVERQHQEFYEAMDRLYRLEVKIKDVELAQPQSQKKLAELDGVVRGMNGELQDLVKRSQGIDSRILDAQRQGEEAWRREAEELREELQAQLQFAAVPLPFAAQEDGQGALLLGSLEQKLAGARQQLEAASCLAEGAAGSLPDCLPEAAWDPPQAFGENPRTPEGAAALAAPPAEVLDFLDDMVLAAHIHAVAGPKLDAIEREAVAGPKLDAIDREVSGLSQKVSVQERALEQVQRLLEMQLEQQRSRHAKESGPIASLQSEVQALRDCIAAAEAAVHSLAPRLVKAAAFAADGNDGKLLKAAQALEASTRSAPSTDVVSPAEEPEEVALAADTPGGLPAEAATLQQADGTRLRPSVGCWPWRGS